MEYVLVIHTAEEGGYWAEVPALDGCFVQGETLEELLEDARGAIASHLDALREEGRSIPAGTGVLIATVRVPEPTAA
ncbi:MAG TPA: type II toxin-antitoxin system HicB family antitoxin [Dehalococcoidia bacterium]|nr:type II toxin-antitoxin system HicB family antitoxin [Dehalococcoidia bacterium]